MLWVISLFTQSFHIVFLHLASTERTADISRAQRSTLRLQFLYWPRFICSVYFLVNFDQLLLKQSAFLQVTYEFSAQYLHIGSECKPIDFTSVTELESEVQAQVGNLGNKIFILTNTPRQYFRFIRHYVKQQISYEYLHF